MRSDIVFYALAGVFFIMTAVSVILIADQVQKGLWLVSTVVLGLFSAGLGYTQRPKTKAVITPPATPEACPPQPAQVTVVVNTAPAPTVEEKTVVATETPKVMEEIAAPIPQVIELTQVKGINDKRAEQLKALGINNIDDLAKASAEDLAKNLTISPKITRMWIGYAKKLKK